LARTVPFEASPHFSHRSINRLHKAHLEKRKWLGTNPLKQGILCPFGLSIFLVEPVFQGLPRELPTIHLKYGIFLKKLLFARRPSLKYEKCAKELWTVRCRGHRNGPQLWFSV